jgi:hypothetical protein
LETPIKLPILDVELPLVGFFTIASLLFVCLHLYLLSQIQVFCGKVCMYKDFLNSNRVSSSEIKASEQRLDTFALVIIYGLSGERGHITVRSLGLIIFVSTIVAPIAVVFQMQAKFLPYHLPYLTWFHRMLVLTDASLIFGSQILFLRYSRRCREIGGILLSVRIVGTTLFLLSAIFISIFTAVYPGEYIYRYRWPALTRLLFEGAIDPVSSQTGTLFSNRLILADQIQQENDKLSKLNISLSLRGRDLREAIFDRADLRQADLTGAD